MIFRLVFIFAVLSATAGSQARRTLPCAKALLDVAGRAIFHPQVEGFLAIPEPRTQKARRLLVVGRDYLRRSELSEPPAYGEAWASIAPTLSAENRALLVERIEKQMDGLGSETRHIALLEGLEVRAFIEGLHYRSLSQAEYRDSLPEIVRGLSGGLSVAGVLSGVVARLVESSEFPAIETWGRVSLGVGVASGLVFLATRDPLMDEPVWGEFRNHLSDRTDLRSTTPDPQFYTVRDSKRSIDLIFWVQPGLEGANLPRLLLLSTTRP